MNAPLSLPQVLALVTWIDGPDLDWTGQSAQEHAVAVAQILQPFGDRVQIIGLLHNVQAASGHGFADLVGVGVPALELHAANEVECRPSQPPDEGPFPEKDVVLAQLACQAHTLHASRLTSQELVDQQVLEGWYETYRERQQHRVSASELAIIDDRAQT
jgi:hypothetical protein